MMLGWWYKAACLKWLRARGYAPGKLLGTRYMRDGGMSWMLFAVEGGAVAVRLTGGRWELRNFSIQADHPPRPRRACGRA